ncbi:uncharacterized protein LOC117576741 [Drosophila albomicans]|uniref:Uncharacterized protein LOC117576741 n=1 Tax=Drosophila albomicans TaxID=7291 RepID=A0A6P8ZF76_DROAB|nr:uncharacterized protein LOC117576741 [Drosophila albomicans]
MHATMRQQLAILLLASLAFELSSAWLFKLPKLEDLVEKLDEKKQKEQLKKLDFLNWFADKEEKKVEEWEKLKQWFEDKKLKELEFFESKKEKLDDEIEGKLLKKKNKIGKKQKTRTTTDCYEATTESTGYEEKSYQSAEQQEDEEDQDEQVAVTKQENCGCKKSKSYGNSVPTAYDVREDYEDGIRYFT